MRGIGRDCEGGLVAQQSARHLDQFFTRSDVAAACVQGVRAHIDSMSGEWLWVEPSAGGGAFFDLLPFPRIGLDIVSQRGDISSVDFLSWHPGATGRRIAISGNPPFGKNAALARRFFDHAAEFADVIAFILPRTFQKPAFVSRLNRHMHLVSEQVLAESSFEFDGAPYAVPTVFQIWEKRQTLRPVAARALMHPDFAFVAARDAHFAFQRVGARAGLVSEEGLRKSPQSHYFLRANIDSNRLFAKLHAIDWSPIKHRTAGNPSIGKGELVQAYQSARG